MSMSVLMIRFFETLSYVPVALVVTVTAMVAELRPGTVAPVNDSEV